MTHAPQGPSVPPWLRVLVSWMDDAVPVPGTGMRVGLDALVGLLLPGAGDALTAVSHVALLWTAFRAGAPRVVLARMVWNVALDAIAGTVPLAGDVFDVFFKANRRNLALLERHGGQGGVRVRATPADYAVVTVAILSVLLLLGLPVMVGVLIVRALFGG